MILELRKCAAVAEVIFGKHQRTGQQGLNNMAYKIWTVSQGTQA